MSPGEVEDFTRGARHAGGSRDPGPAGIRPSPSNPSSADETPDAPPPSPGSLWRTAREAIALLAVDPTLGLRLRSRAGFARDALLAELRKVLPEGTPVLRLPAGAGGATLTGGLDLAATLAAGRPIAEVGLLARADSGVLMVAMAERMGREASGILANVLDTGRVAVERDGLSLDRAARFGLLALDEGMDADETPPTAITERLALVVDLDGADPRRAGAAQQAHEVEPSTESGSEVPVGADRLRSPCLLRNLDAGALAEARARLPNVVADDRMLELIVQAAVALGVASLRAPIQALAAARAAAALAGGDRIDEAALEIAVRHVLGPRATQMPQMMPEPAEENDDQENDARGEDRDEDYDPRNGDAPFERDDRPEKGDDETASQTPPEDMAIDTAPAELPADLLERLAALARPAPFQRSPGRSGPAAKSAKRGRVVGTRAGDPRRDRIDLIATLTAAAPWQPLRRREAAISEEVEFVRDASSIRTPSRVHIRSDDIRVRRFKGKQETATIFAVDASGSAALARLAEAKGAVELILAECYVRRDRVALVAFRGTRADILLPETRSLTRAKRALSAFPGGGGTPLASGITAALSLARASARDGRTPLIALLTDGRANISADGVAGRAKANTDAMAAAANVRASGYRSLIVDVGQRPGPAARAIADKMGGTYLALPRADSRALSDAVAEAGASRGATRGASGGALSTRATGAEARR